LHAPTRADLIDRLKETRSNTTLRDLQDKPTLPSRARRGLLSGIKLREFLRDSRLDLEQGDQSIWKLGRRQHAQRSSACIPSVDRHTYSSSPSQPVQRAPSRLAAAALRSLLCAISSRWTFVVHNVKILLELTVLDQLEVLAGRIGIARTTAIAGCLSLTNWRADGQTGANECFLDRRSIRNFCGLLRSWKLSLPVESHGFDSFRKGLRCSAAKTDKLRGSTSWDLGDRKWLVAEVRLGLRGGSRSGASWGNGRDRGGGPDRGVEPGRLGVSLDGQSGTDGGGRRCIGVPDLGRDVFHFTSDTRVWLE
jgi:hypothetical protein